MHARQLRFGTALAAIALLFASASAEAYRTKSGIDVYFNHSTRSRYTEPYRNLTRSGDDLEAVIVREINGAQKSLDIAVQELRLPEVAKAIVRRKKAGVQVRIVLEDSYNNTFPYLTRKEVDQLPDLIARQRTGVLFDFLDLDNNGKLSDSERLDRDAVLILRRALVPTVDDRHDGTLGSGLMHHKFIVIDGRRVLVSSANFTLSDVHGDIADTSTRGNANAMLVFDGKALAASFEREFNLMWGKGPEDTATGRFGARKAFRGAEDILLPNGDRMIVQFSPTSRSTSNANPDDTTNGLIARTVSGARRSADFALFVFTDDGISKALESVHHRGVGVRGLVDSHFAYRPYSILLSMLGLAVPDEKDCRKTANTPWRRPVDSVGVPRIPAGDKLHHKFAVVDDEKVIFGSHNWSSAADHINDEVLLVIDDAEVAALFQTEFSRLYRSARTGVPPWLKDDVEFRQGRCGHR